MIRVTARHINDADGVLVGDLPPSEVRPLLELLDSTDIHFGGLQDVSLYESPAQFIDTGGPGAPRLCLEILLVGGG